MPVVELSVDVTYQCPFSCPFCSSSQNTLPVDMGLDTALACLDFAHRIGKNGPIVITIGGGEPITLDILSLFISVWSKNSNIIKLCTTAGTEVEKDYWRTLSSIGLRIIHLSIPCVRDCQDVIGENYEFAVVDRNIERIMNAGIEIYVNFVLTKMNSNSFDEVLGYCISKGIKKIRVLGLAKQGRAIKNWRRIALPNSEIEFVVKRITERFRGLPITLEFAGLPNYERCTHMDNGRCLGGKSFFHINTSGDVYPCPSTKSIKSERIGSVFDFKGILAFKRFPCEENRILES